MLHRVIKGLKEELRRMKSHILDIDATHHRKSLTVLVRSFKNHVIN